MKYIILYGSSCCMKTTLAEKLSKAIDSHIISCSNSHAIEYYSCLNVKAEPIDLLVSRAMFYEGVGIPDINSCCILDRFLIDELIWSYVLSGKTEIPLDELNMIFGWETDLTGTDPSDTLRILLVNEDEEFIRKTCEPRLGYLGLNQSEESKERFISLCKEFNKKFIDILSDEIHVVVINDVHKEVLDSDKILNEILSLL